MSWLATAKTAESLGGGRNVARPHASCERESQDRHAPMSDWANDGRRPAHIRRVDSHAAPRVVFNNSFSGQTPLSGFLAVSLALLSRAT
jgi:hypothetical protein